MKILWFPRLQFDTDKLHITTWREMCNELEDMGHAVKIAIAGIYDPDVIDCNHIPVFIIRKKYFRIITFWFNGFFQFIKYILKFKPDAIILDLFTIWFSVPLMFIPKKSRALIIVDIRTPLYSEMNKRSSPRDWFLRNYTKCCYFYYKKFLNGMTVITSYFKNEISNQISIDPSSLGVWGSGVDVVAFSPDKFRNNNRPQFLKGKFVIMQHGSISYNRGILETVHAIKFLGNKDVVLVLIGDSIGKCRAKEDVVRLSKELDIEQQICFVPSVSHSEIPEYISYCDCAVMAYPNIEYWNNNNPIKLLEYFAMGKVVICTDIWTFRDVAGDKQCAYYIKNNTPEEIAGAVWNCYKNKKLLRKWGSEGIGIASERFTWSKQAENLLNYIYQTSKENTRQCQK